MITRPGAVVPGGSYRARLCIASISRLIPLPNAPVLVIAAAEHQGLEPRGFQIGIGACRPMSTLAAPPMSRSEINRSHPKRQMPGMRPAKRR